MIRTRKDLADSLSAGRTWLGMYRRSGPAMAVGCYSDLSYGAGIPVANYYASTPLASATLAASDGICGYAPVPASGMTQYLLNALIVPTTTVGIVQFELVDICLYYPFVDGDGGLQYLTNPNSFTRYSAGLGCRIMVVSQGVGTGVVDAVVTYTGCDGTSGKTINATLNLAAPAGQLCSSLPTGAATYAVGAYLPLATGCGGVRSIQSVEYTSSGGGIAAFAIVKPLGFMSMFEATVAPVEVDFAADRTFKLPIMETGCYLSLIAKGTTAATPSFIGAFQTVWG